VSRGKPSWAAGFAMAVLGAAAASPSAADVEVLVSDVPSYGWHYGCGPSAGGMLIGTWDGRAEADRTYEDLIDGSNDWDTNGANVRAMIASTGHIEDFWGPDAPQPWHTFDCVADFMQCSVDPRGDGQSYENQQHAGLRNYAASRGYAETVAGWQYYGGLWARLVHEIDAGRPMELFVDPDGDTDGHKVPTHFVTAIGYRYAGGDPEAPQNPQYCLYDPNYRTQQLWYAFRPVGDGTAYSVQSGAWFDPYDERPVADAAGPYVLDLAASDRVTLDGSGSTDGDGQVARWDWDLNGDGLAEVNGEAAEVSATLLDVLGWQVGQERSIWLRVADDQDAACAEAATTTLLYLPASRTPGDADMDGVVDEEDLDVLLAHFGTPAGMNWLDGDFDQDEAVDDADLSLLLKNFTHSQGSAVPEPTALGILPIGGILGLRRRTTRAFGV